MDRFENKVASNGVHYSRIIASWAKEAGDVGLPYMFRGVFGTWLRTLGLPENEVKDICFIADNGKMELESSASKFLKEDADLSKKGL